MHELSVDERGDWARALQLARQGYSPEEVADILMPQIIARKTAAVERLRRPPPREPCLFSSV
jgi:hypothetical protein